MPIYYGQSQQVNTEKDLSGCASFSTVLSRYVVRLLVTRNGHIRKLLLPSFIVFDDVYENCGLLARYKKNF